ncbi:MAG: type III ribulose-bisphosphate carboxylase [Hadesarchaea archaeon CG08_land_8_20_14_0_20_51_8]|nr:MAG: type III ribulose-bisphosphate carboxylase [Hadesarchaea archaeon CG08_land_8_20_14_0_20_51_8]
MKIEWYHDFVNKKYRPRKSDIKVLFYYEPAQGITKEDAIGRIASESSSGTWTTLTELPKLLPKTKAYAYSYDSHHVKVAYPIFIFEEGSVPGMMSGIGGNIFGMKAVKNLKLLDAELPPEYIKNFKGPTYGKDVIKKIFKRRSGPVTAVVPKPKIGYTAREHAVKVAYAIWKGGMDCVKDDENLTNQKFNRFEDRVKLVAKYRDKAEKETGDVKEAFLNVTAPDLKELERRIKLVHDNGFRYFMLDVLVSGYTAVQTASELAHDYGMAIHGHRAMHAMMTKNPKHGMSMLYIAKLMRLMGIDQLHIGTVIGKLVGKKDEIVATKEMIMQQEVDEILGLRMPQKWGTIKPMLPVASGGLHPGLLPQIFDIYGTMDIVLQVGGGTQGHPMGIEAGARAVMQAIEAYKQGISLDEYAETKKELKSALEKWGYIKPK